MESDQGRMLRVCVVSSDGRSVESVLDALAGTGLETVAVRSMGESTAAGADVYVVDIDGVGSADPAVVAELRAVTSAAIVALSHHDEVEVRLACFAAGADDYLCHGWGLGDLGPRVRLRAQATEALSTRSPLSSAMSLISDGHALLVRGRRVAVTPRERELLALLIAHPGRLFTRSELLQTIWGSDWPSAGIVTEYVRRIRTSLKPHGADRCLVTRHRYGYLWDPELLAVTE